jgi:hypothetical protein
MKAGLVLSAGIVIAVGGVRGTRFLLDPGAFLAHDTEHFDAIDWMNRQLDPARDRVVTRQRASYYLRIPWFNIGQDFQVEIAPEERADPQRFHEALLRQRVTYVFGTPEELQALAPWLEPVYTNDASLIGGAHFFRAPPVEPIAVYRLM